ncbi:MAG: tyrosine-type recombinase/integrase [Planctomycetes bacterium]|nr:tyrosine-type recombinase/integrase [Planctomycetota bacterium]
MTPSQAARTPKTNRGRAPRDHYTKDSYRRAIARAYEKAGVEPWSPNRLRHSRATFIREKYGIEAAQVVLGHSDAKLTAQVYAERDFALAERVVREIG